MKRSSFIVTAGALTVVAVALAAFWPIVALQYELLQFDLSNPERDAKAAVQRGKPKCFSVAGYARSFPGATNPSEIEYCNSIESHISGTSDVHLGPFHSLQNQAAVSYAARFNDYVLAHRGSRAP